MAKSTNDDKAPLTATAEFVGRALGRVAGTVDALMAEHPHPVDEVREALAEGQTRVAAIAAEIEERAGTAVGEAKAAMAKTRKTMTRARRRAARTTARATRKTRKVVTRATKRTRKIAKKAAKRTRKTVRRVKKAAGRARKAAARTTSRVRR